MKKSDKDPKYSLDTRSIVLLYSTFLLWSAPFFCSGEKERHTYGCNFGGENSRCAFTKTHTHTHTDKKDQKYSVDNYFQLSNKGKKEDQKTANDAMCSYQVLRSTTLRHKVWCNNTVSGSQLSILGAPSSSAELFPTVRVLYMRVFFCFVFFLVFLVFFCFFAYDVGFFYIFYDNSFIKCYSTIFFFFFSIFTHQTQNVVLYQYQHGKCSVFISFIYLVNIFVVRVTVLSACCLAWVNYC